METIDLNEHGLMKGSPILIRSSRGLYQPFPDYCERIGIRMNSNCMDPWIQRGPAALSVRPDARLPQSGFVLTQDCRTVRPIARMYHNLHGSPRRKNKSKTERPDARLSLVGPDTRINETSTKLRALTPDCRTVRPPRARNLLSHVLLDARFNQTGYDSP